MQLTLPLPEVAQLAGGSPPTPSHRIYCNRSLRLEDVDWVGFDMDYTLAIYDQDEMDRLSIEATITKLLERGYPAALRDMKYRTDFPIRGLLVDRKLGNTRCEFFPVFFTARPRCGHSSAHRPQSAPRWKRTWRR